jgi:hypothetical protein
MKVKDLIAELQGFDQDAEVHYEYCYGDHWRTNVAPMVQSINEGAVEYSEYHRMDKMANYEDCYDEDTGEPKEATRRVVVLS